MIEADSGAVTLIQPFGSAANLNIHLHCRVLDGVYRRGADHAPEFVEAPAPRRQRQTPMTTPGQSCHRGRRTRHLRKSDRSKWRRMVVRPPVHRRQAAIRIDS